MLLEFDEDFPAELLTYRSFAMKGLFSNLEGILFLLYVPSYIPAIYKLFAI